ncbi:unnamed protein product [Coccothraustes coccothraustes]
MRRGGRAGRPRARGAAGSGAIWAEHGPADAAPLGRHRDPTAAPPTPEAGRRCRLWYLAGGLSLPAAAGAAGRAFPRNTARLTGVASIGDTCAGPGAALPKGFARAPRPEHRTSAEPAGAELFRCARAASHPDKTGLPHMQTNDLRMGIDHE